MDQDVQKKEDVVLQLLCMTDQSTINVCSGPSGPTEVDILDTLHFILLDCTRELHILQFTSQKVMTMGNNNRETISMSRVKLNGE